MPYPRFGFVPARTLRNAIAVGRAEVSLGAAFAVCTGISFLAAPLFEIVRDALRAEWNAQPTVAVVITSPGKLRNRAVRGSINEGARL